MRARQDITPGHDAQATRPQTTRLREPALWTRSETRGAAEVQRIRVTCCVSAARTMCGFLPGGLPLPDSSPFGDRLTNRPASRQRAACLRVRFGHSRLAATWSRMEG